VGLLRRFQQFASATTLITAPAPLPSRRYRPSKTTCAPSSPTCAPPRWTLAAPADASGVYLDIHSYSELVLWPWGFTSDVAPNGPALQTLGRKLAYFNGYEPDQSIGLYPTDGTTVDFAYGDLGLAAYTFELGTAFFESCSLFEETIVPDNLPALLYAAKVARAPFLTPAGPEALDAAVAPASAGGGERRHANGRSRRYALQ
jgi:carboxypeptidase T